MAQVTFTIPDTKIQLFIDAYGRDYDQLVANGDIDGGAVTKAEYAKTVAFDFLATYVRKWDKQTKANLIAEVDITEA